MARAVSMRAAVRVEKGISAEGGERAVAARAAEAWVVVMVAAARAVVAREVAVGAVAATATVRMAAVGTVAEKTVGATAWEGAGVKGVAAAARVVGGPPDRR